MAVEFGAIATLIGAIATFVLAIVTILVPIIQKKQAKKDATSAPPQTTSVMQPDNAAQVLRNEGDEYLKLGKNAEALAKYRAAAKTEPDEALNHDKLAEVLNKLGRHDEALEENIKAVARETNPRKRAKYYQNKANTLLNLKRTEDAVADMREAVRLAPDIALYHHDLGECLWRIKEKRNEAVPPLKKATELAPDNAKYHFKLGLYLRELGRYNEAAPPLKKATELAPDNAEYHFELGLYLRELGRDEEAVPPLKKATELAPDNVFYEFSLHEAERALQESPT